jgi:hypothetical protein
MSVATSTVPAAASTIVDAVATPVAAPVKVVAPAKAPKAAPAKKAAPVVKGHVTKALTNLTLAKTAKAKAIKVDDREVTAVRTSNDGLRVDHSACKHATTGPEGKKARAACRNSIAKALAKK